jgi:hypothetical protein
VLLVAVATSAHAGTRMWIWTGLDANGHWKRGEYFDTAKACEDSGSATMENVNRQREWIGSPFVEHGFECRADDNTPPPDPPVFGLAPTTNPNAAGAWKSPTTR